MVQKLLQQQLRDVGSKLENPPASKDALVNLLKILDLLVDQVVNQVDANWTVIESNLNGKVLVMIGNASLRVMEVKVLVATCICEITRITAPEAPYSDDVLRDLFHLIVSTFSGLGDINSPLFGRRVVILEALARYSDDHPQNVLTSMQTIMVLILDESEDIQENLLRTILSALGRKRNDYSMAARRLAMNVIECCAGKLEPCILQFLISTMSGNNSYLNKSLDYCEVIYDVYQCAPQILSGIIPYITGELLADELDVWQKAVQLLGDLFALPGGSISESFLPLFSEFLKRLTDRVVEVRISVIEHLKNCLMSNPSRPEAPQIIKALRDRLLDYDENVRKQVVSAVCDVAFYSLKVIPAEEPVIGFIKTPEKCSRMNNCWKLDYYELKAISDFFYICLSETIELILCGSLFSSEFSIKDKEKHWVTVFSGFDKVEVKALERFFCKSKGDFLLDCRLQQEMQKYLSLRQTHQVCKYLISSVHLLNFKVLLQISLAEKREDAPELQKRISGSFRSMSRLFNDPAKAEECFQILNQLKDGNIWKILRSQLDPSTSFHQAWSYRDEMLKILGERHPLYDFMGMLSIKCSYLLFNKEYVKEILAEAVAQQCVGNMKLTLSCMNLLTFFGIKTLMKSYLPAKDAHLRPGIEELVDILKNILSFGDISDTIESSAADKAHLRLASAKAVLQLSRHWDHKIPADVFYVTLRMSQEIIPWQSAPAYQGKAFGCKVCLFLLVKHKRLSNSRCKQNLLEAVQVCQQLKVRQLSMQYITCYSDLGLSIAKRLVPDQTDISVISTVPLPPMLYKPVEKNKDVSSVDADEQSWLGGESALAHFEALKIENKEMIDSGAAKDEIAQEVSDRDESGKRKRDKSTIEVAVPTPKRKGSVSVQRSHSAKAHKESREIPCTHSIEVDEKSHISFGKKLLMERGMTGSTDSNLLASCLSTVRSSASRNGKKDDDGFHVEKVIGNDQKKSTSSVDSSKKTSQVKSLPGSAKNRKPYVLYPVPFVPPFDHAAISEACTMVFLSIISCASNSSSDEYS
ncbi:hypothetical protein COCNU_01G013620 [Cocos nucifera]|uniref:Uncharacterized protein n=1 Tax=Cocos nucifera TaxID=13894 RepID=A0A8K0HW28_COCNU|nr:hypothetical protein COCNU_01G013620 [Cocos nucifera]